MKAILIGIALALIVFAQPAAAASDGTISDPRQWCGEFTQTVADKNTDKMLDMLVAGAMATTAKLDVAQGFSSIPPLLARAGQFRSSEFLLERAYGKSLVRLWYMLLFERGAVFVRCEEVKIAEKWAVLGVSFQTMPQGIDLP
jgi:hypothetical protein